MCLLGLNIYDDSADDDLPWQKLESVLTVYIELVETRKVIAFHKDLEFADDVAFYNAHDPALSGLRYARDRPNAMIVDPATGHAKRKGAVDPWVCMPSTEKDLNDTLEMWKILVEAIHDRSGHANVDAEPTYGLANDQLLDAMPDCFAKRFFARAIKPRFKYIAQVFESRPSKNCWTSPTRHLSHEKALKFHLS